MRERESKEAEGLDAVGQDLPFLRQAVVLYLLHSHTSSIPRLYTVILWKLT